MSKNIKKQYKVNYRNITYTVKLIKNEIWRWTMDYESGVKGFPRFSSKSNALTHWGAAKEMNKRIDEDLKAMKRAGLLSNNLSKEDGDVS